MPGVSSGDISARFNVRGGQHEELLVRLDGMELFEPFHLKDFLGVFSVLDPKMIGGVELVPGGFTAEYGDRMTGVMEMTSRKPDTLRFDLGISFTNAWFNAGGSFADGQGRWMGSVRRGYLDVVLSLVEDDEGTPTEPRYWDAFGSLEYDLSQRHTLGFKLLFAGDTLTYENDDPNELTTVETGYDNTYVWLRHQGVFGRRSFANTSIYGGQVTVDRDLYFEGYGGADRAELIDRRVVDFVGLRMDWEHELSTRNYFRWGLDARNYEVSYEYLNDTRVENPIRDPRFAPAIRVYSFDDDFKGEWYSLYASDRLRVGKRFTAELGIRYDRLSLTDEDAVSPRVNLVFDVGKGGALRFGWGHYYQSQRPYELDVQFNQDEFYPSQRAEHFVLGFEGPVGRAVTLRADAYIRAVQDPQPRWETITDPFHPVPEVAIDLARIRRCRPRPTVSKSPSLHVAAANSTGG